jgi:signal transduction histidine kinase
MRFPTAIANAQERSRRPGTWGAALLFGGVWHLLHWGAGPGGWAPEGWLLPFLLGAVLLVFTPFPWQWTGDDRPLASFARGLLQALLANLAVVWMLLALLPWPPDHGMMMSRGMHMGQQPLHGPGWLPPWQLRLFILGLATLIFGVLLGRILAEREGERLRADEAERRAREAQTRALQAQMNPHVLFNAISGLAELAREDSTATEAALVKLAELLRRLLDHAGRTTAPLAQERGLVEGLLALEQFRLGDRLRVTWAWDASLEGLLAPPLLLQPLVENAIKHGIAPNRAGGELEIGLSGSKEALLLWVANTGQPYKGENAAGMGLANLRQRLALMPGEPGQLELRNLDGRTLAELRFRPTEAGHG